jgi:hypothetical protein
MADMDLLLEAEKRGILPEDKKPLLQEARKRGLVPEAPEPNKIERGKGTFKWGNRDVPEYDPSQYAGRGSLFKAAMVGLAGFSDPILGVLQRGTELGEKIGIVSPKTKKAVQGLVDQRQEEKQIIGGRSLPFKATEFAGQMLPIALIPGGNAKNWLSRATSNAGIGAASGYALPTASGENAFANLLIGGAGGATLSGIEGGVNYLARSNLPERLYGSAVKLPPSRKWTKVLPGKEMSARNAAVEEGMRSEIPPSEYGLAKAIKNKQQTGRAYGEKLREREAALPSEDIHVKVDAVLERGLRRAYQRAADSDDIAGNKAILDAYKETLKAGRREHLTPGEANSLKAEIYKDINFIIESKSSSTRFQQVAKKGVARELDKALDAMFPELEGINARYGARKDLIEALERYMGREGNKNMIGLGTKVLLRPHLWPAAILDSTLGHPQVKARLAFLLNKVRRSKGLSSVGNSYITQQISKGIPIAASEAEN